MEISIRIREKLRKGLITVCLFYCGFHSALLDTPADPILTESNKIKIIRMGELYRYIFSQYHALDTARQALIPIRRLYPQACIREYQEGKLGPIIDMNIDHRINDKTYDAR